MDLDVHECYKIVRMAEVVDVPKLRIAKVPVLKIARVPELKIAEVRLFCCMLVNSIF